MKMRFVGYSLTQKGYRLYDENKRKIFIRRDVTFNETASDMQTKYNWKLKKRMMSPLKKIQTRRNHPILDVQHEKESHQFITMMNTLVLQQQSIQPSL